MGGRAEGEGEEGEGDGSCEGPGKEADYAGVGEAILEALQGGRGRGRGGELDEGRGEVMRGRRRRGSAGEWVC